MTTPMQSLRSFLQIVNLYAADVATPVALVALRLAASEFCRRTRMWKEQITVTVTQNPFAVTFPNAVIQAIDEATWTFAAPSAAWLAANPGWAIAFPYWAAESAVEGLIPQPGKLVPATVADLKDPQWDTRIGYPKKIVQVTPSEMMLWPFSPGSIDMLISVYPEEGGVYGANLTGPSAQELQNMVPAFLFTDHAEAIAAGALKRILFMPGKSYTNASLATIFSGQFDQAIAKANVKAAKGIQRAPLRVTGQWM